MDGALGHAARRCRRAAACFALSLFTTGFAFALALAPALAAPATQIAALGSAEPETIIARVTLNQQKKGEFFVTIVNGEFLLRARDLKAIGLDGKRGRSWQAGGEEYVWVASIPDLAVAFDEAELSLDLTAGAGLLPTTTVDLWAGRSGQAVHPDNASVFFNYELGYAGGNRGVPDGAIAATQFGGRVGDFLLLSDASCNSLSGSTRCVRLTTSLVHDRRDTLVRTIVGDFGVATGLLGSSYGMGGVSYSKLYDIDPYLIRFPQQSLTGQLQTPSEVDVYIDGQRVRTLRLPAGDYDLRNVTQTTGLRSVDLVVRDAFGREQRIGSTFYASERSLKAGLHEYSYNLGKLRQNLGVESNNYGDLAFAGFHRYGVSDALTVGARVESTSRRVSGGPSAAIVLGSAGLLGLAASFSDDDGRTGAAALASYSYQGRNINGGVIVRKDSSNYTTLFAPTERRDWEAAATIGYTAPGVGSLSIGAIAYRSRGGDDRRAASVSYGNTVLGGRGSFFVTVVNDWSDGRRTDVFAGFSYNFDPSYALSGYYQRLAGGTRETLQFQKAQPVGEGLGYVLGVSRNALGGEYSSTTAAGPRYAGTPSSPTARVRRATTRCRWRAASPGRRECWPSADPSPTASAWSRSTNWKASASSSTTRKSAAPGRTAGCSCRPWHRSSTTRSRSTSRPCRSTTPSPSRCASSRPPIAPAPRSTSAPSACRPTSARCRSAPTGRNARRSSSTSSSTAAAGRLRLSPAAVASSTSKTPRKAATPRAHRRTAPAARSNSSCPLRRGS